MNIEGLLAEQHLRSTAPHSTDPQEKDYFPERIGEPDTRLDNITVSGRKLFIIGSADRDHSLGHIIGSPSFATADTRPAAQVVIGFVGGSPVAWANCRLISPAENTMLGTAVVGTSDVGSKLHSQVSSLGLAGLYGIESLEEHPWRTILFGGLNTQVVGSDDALNGYEDFESPNWDGEGAEPISSITLAYARWLLKILPTNFGQPDIAPSADGLIGLEWIFDRGPLHKLFMDIGPGESWRAYWKRRDGTFDRLSGASYSDLNSFELQRLFRKLSK